MNTIKDLLFLTDARIQGTQTRIVADYIFDEENNHHYMVLGKYKKGSYTIILYQGDSEEEAVKAFIENERKD